MSGRSDLGDWLRAVSEMRPGDQDTLNAITRILSLRLEDHDPLKREVAARGSTIPDEGASPATAPAVEQPAPNPRPRVRVESVLTPSNASRNRAPAWLAAARQLESANPANLRRAIPMEPLFPRRTTRALLNDALATPSETGALNLPAIVEVISQARVVDELPRLSVPTLVQGVQLLVDGSEAMQPFAIDQMMLRAALASVVGRDRTAILHFDGSPLWGAGSGPKEDWPPYSPPAAGTPVVVLTDLGIGQPPGTAGLAGPGDWREFGVTLARAHCPLLALVPYPPRRWPASLARVMTIVQWDRATTASVILKTVGGGLRAVREA